MAASLADSASGGAPRRLRRGVLTNISTYKVAVYNTLREEIKTLDGDMIAVFLKEAVAPGMSAVETIAAVREQGGLVGVPLVNVLEVNLALRELYGS